MATLQERALYETTELQIQNADYAAMLQMLMQGEAVEERLAKRHRADEEALHVSTLCISLTLPTWPHNATPPAYKKLVAALKTRLSPALPPDKFHLAAVNLGYTSGPPTGFSTNAIQLMLRQDGSAVAQVEPVNVAIRDGRKKAKNLSKARAGTGSLVDALVFLSLGETGIRLDSQLYCWLFLDPATSRGPILALELVIAVRLSPTLFSVASDSTAKHIVFGHLLPPAPPPAEWHGTTSAGFFYRCLKRAPVTRDGRTLPVALIQAVATPNTIAESEEERERRVRRDEKGKAREILPIEQAAGALASEAAEEDVLLRGFGLQVNLMPFQSRTVRWMLKREGKIAVPVVEDGDRITGFTLVDDAPEELLRLRRGPLWEKVDLELLTPKSTGETVHSLWVHQLTNTVREDDPAARPIDDADAEKHDDRLDDMSASGLFEEMGLGKTLEIIALILLGRQPSRNSLPSYFEPLLDSDVQPVDLTLIIAPLTLRKQWADELTARSNLRVLVYVGLSAVSKKTSNIDVVNSYDVILTSFDVLKKELLFARKPHQRDLRSDPADRAKYRRSLLVGFNFLRVIIDEAQLVTPATREMASLIPRRYSHAVTGTPIEKIEDARDLFKFLRLGNVGESSAAFRRLQGDPALFRKVIQELGERTNKDEVSDQLELKVQRRFLVPVKFGDVEEYWYQTRYAEALADLGLDNDGRPTSTLWAPDFATMNRWLSALRRSCCHSTFGLANKPVAGGGAAAFFTVEEVLANLKSQSATDLHQAQRALLDGQVKTGQLMCYELEECEGAENALRVFDAVLQGIEPLIAELVGLAQSAIVERKSERTGRDRSASQVAETEVDLDRDMAEALALEEDALPNAQDHLGLMRTPADKEITIRITALRSRIRECLFVKHAAHFFMGSVYHNLGKFTALEEASYELADEVRNVLLQPYEAQVLKSNARLATLFKARDVLHVFDIVDLEVPFTLAKPGIASAGLWSAIEHTSDVLNGFAELIWAYRETISIICQSKVSLEVVNEVEGIDDYAERAETQEKCGIHLEAFTLALSEWRHALTGERSALDTFGAVAMVTHNKDVWSAPKNSRRSAPKAASAAYLTSTPSLSNASAGEVLRHRLFKEQAEVKGAEPLSPLKALLKRTREAVGESERLEEIAILNAEIKRLAAVLNQKEKILDRLGAELADFTRTFNTRIDYFKQLQVISDDVADPKTEAKSWRGFTAEIAVRQVAERELGRKIRYQASQRRYLESLSARRDVAQTEACLMCAEDYMDGVLTSCGHASCAACFKIWRNQSNRCPVCKSLLGPKEFTLTKKVSKEQEAAASEAAKERLDKLKAANTAPALDVADISRPVLCHLDAKTIAAVKATPYYGGSLSAKSTMIVKHIRYIRKREPTAKIVLLSAWTESLSLLMAALRTNSIDYVRLEGAGTKKDGVVGRFNDDPDVAVFLLHTLSQGAGLNLIAARYVMLVEPLVHSAVELQAVGRVHRIGQTKETCVFQYYVANTVDQRVAELRGRQGTSLFLPGMSLESKAAGEASARGGIETEVIQDPDDVAQCLFGPAHMQAIQASLLARPVVDVDDVDM